MGKQRRTLAALAAALLALSAAGCGQIMETAASPVGQSETVTTTAVQGETAAVGGKT